MKSFLLQNLSLSKVTTLKYKNDRDVLKDYWFEGIKMTYMPESFIWNAIHMCTYNYAQPLLYLYQKYICLLSYII